MRHSRREFAQLFAIGGSAALFAARPAAWARPELAAATAPPDERFWSDVREQYVMPRGYICLNAANLCPSPARVLDAYFDGTRSVDRDPSPQNRQKTRDGREATRRALAAFLRATPEEIVITRNTSESNNIVSSGLDLKAGDEVLLFSDNHPSNHDAWRQKSQRFGFTVRVVDQVNPHPGAQFYVDAFRKQMTPRTKVVAFTHVTSTVGDLMPAAELCRLARDHGALSLVDGAQSFGVLDVDLSRMQPDFFTGSAHKWPCGPKENGLLYVNKQVHDRIKPSIVSLYPGDVGISRSLEAFGQRDEPAMMGFGEALAFQTKIGQDAIEKRSRELTQLLIEGLGRISGVKVWTHPDPARSTTIVSFRPAALEVRKLHQALYEKDRVVCATRGGADRGGLRFSPHFYNVRSDIERAVDAVARYIAKGL
ncbi:MAG TPA: aminotransferase class V-fold PLP-dependent enzyme [Vicinamibacterales bacterium]|jgi:selenocysteine lyase/cysteine desulfurase